MTIVRKISLLVALEVIVTQEPIIDKLERLERERTPGEWAYTEEWNDGPCYWVHPEPQEDGPGLPFNEADAELIALAPALLSQLREQREELATERRLRMEDGMDKGRLQIVLAAAEHTVREQREALRVIDAKIETWEDGHSGSFKATLALVDEVQSTALAALAPNTEGEGTGPTKDCPSCGTGWYFAAHRSTITCDCGTVVARPPSPQVEGN